MEARPAQVDLAQRHHPRRPAYRVAVPTANGRTMGSRWFSMLRRASHRWANDPGCRRRRLASRLDDFGRPRKPLRPRPRLPAQESGLPQVVDESRPLSIAQDQQRHRSRPLASVYPRAGTGGISRWRTRSQPPGAQSACRQRPGLVRSTQHPIGPHSRSMELRSPPSSNAAAPAATSAQGPEELSPMGKLCPDRSYPELATLVESTDGNTWIAGRERA